MSKKGLVEDSILRDLTVRLHRIEIALASCARLASQLAEIERSVLNVHNAAAASYRRRADFLLNRDHGSGERIPLVSIADLVKELGVCRHTIAALRKKPDFPQRVPVGSRVAFLREDIDRWLDSDRNPTLGR